MRCLLKLTGCQQGFLSFPYHGGTDSKTEGTDPRPRTDPCFFDLMQTEGTDPCFFAIYGLDLPPKVKKIC